MTTPELAANINPAANAIFVPDSAVVTRVRTNGRHFVQLADIDGTRHQVTGSSPAAVEAKLRSRAGWTEWLDAVSGAGIRWDPNRRAGRDAGPTFNELCGAAPTA